MFDKMFDKNYLNRRLVLVDGGRLNEYKCLVCSCLIYYSVFREDYFIDDGNNWAFKKVELTYEEQQIKNIIE